MHRIPLHGYFHKTSTFPSKYSVEHTTPSLYILKQIENKRIKSLFSTLHDLILDTIVLGPPAKVRLNNNLPHFLFLSKLYTGSIINWYIMLIQLLFTSPQIGFANIWCWPPWITPQNQFLDKFECKLCGKIC